MVGIWKLPKLRQGKNLIIKGQPHLKLALQFWVGPRKVTHTLPTYISYGLQPVQEFNVFLQLLEGKIYDASLMDTQ